MPSALAVVADKAATTISSTEPARVRIPVRLVPYAEVVLKSKNGSSRIDFRPGKELTHNLRARVDVTNHFYFAGWHVEAVPLQWRRDTLKYVVQLNVYRLHGNDDSLEEKIGSMQVSGYLTGERDRIYTLAANAATVFKNKSGEPLLSMSAGLNTAADAKHLQVAKGESESR